MDQNENITPTEEFVVRQSVFFNFFLGIFFTAICIGVFFTIRGDGAFTGVDYIKFTATLFVPGIGLFIHGSRRDLVLKMNASGIYFGNNLITTWDRLARAYTSEVDEDRGYDIRFALFVEYYPTNSDTAYVMTLPLPGTIDKSVEEISAAIDRFTNVK